MKFSESSDLKTTLEQYILKHIPISSAIGITVDAASLNQIVLRAPFINNINHKNTVFGGSLHAVATLACWSLLHVNLEHLLKSNFQVVIASSEIKYLAPVATDFQAECSMPSPLDWNQFLKTFQKKEKARLKLSTKIFQEGRLCVDYIGVFVAIST